MNYFLFFTLAGWLIVETVNSLEESQELAECFDEYATFADSYLPEDVAKFDEPYRLIRF